MHWTRKHRLSPPDFYQKSLYSDLASAGVIFTLDTETGFPDVVFITGSYSLGESVVQGAAKLIGSLPILLSRSVAIAQYSDKHFFIFPQR